MSAFGANSHSLRILWYLFKPHKRKMAAVLLFMVLSSLFESLNLIALYPIINYGLNINSTSKSLEVLNSLVRMIGSENLFFSSCLLLLFVTVIAAAVKIIYQYSANKLLTQIVSGTQKAVFRKFLNLDYRFFVKSQQGKLVYASTIAPAGIMNNIYYIIRVANGALTCLFFMVLLFVLAWQGTVLILIIGAFYVLIVKRVMTHTVKHSANLLVEEDKTKNVILNEFISGIRSIKAFGALEFWKRKYDSTVDKSIFYNFRVLMGRMVPDSFMKFTFFITLGVIGIFYSFKGESDILPLVPLLGTFVMMASRLVPYVNLLGSDIVSVARYMPDSHTVYNLLCEDMSEVKDGIKELEGFNDKIAFASVWFKYPEMEDYLLKGISFSIEKKKTTAIVGTSGCGKTTIINLILRLYDAGSGSITIDGVDIRDIRLSSYLSKIGYVSQETFIFNGTIRENIRFGLPNIGDEDILGAARLANAHDFITATENGYETLVGDHGMKLSGGQRQRLAIARAILRKPEIIIFDEATSSLDNVSERFVQEAISKIAKQATLIIIAHRLSTIQKADKIIVIERGTIMEWGTHEELLQKESAYFSLYKNS